MNEQTMPLTPSQRGQLGGRPRKFTPAAVKKILRCVQRGLPLGLAAQAASISSQTLANHRARNSRFAEALTRAIAKGADSRLRKIEAACDAGDWRACAWLAEHTMPQYFARNRVEVTGADGAPLAAAIQLYLPRKDDSGPVIDVTTAGDVETIEGGLNEH